MGMLAAGNREEGGSEDCWQEERCRSEVPRPQNRGDLVGARPCPSWIASAKNRDKFLVDGSAARAKPATTGKAKAAGNYVRGPQPAMYKDKNSGATWSGRGRAPRWIAEAKDRSKFLIG
jgi:hypothetical protein